MAEGNENMQNHMQRVLTACDRDKKITSNLLLFSEPKQVTKQMINLPAHLNIEPL